MKAKKRANKDISVAQSLDTCVIRISPGNSSRPVDDDFVDNNLALMMLTSSSTGPKTDFWIQFITDGIPLNDPGYNEGDAIYPPRVTMYMNWGRFESMKAMIQQSQSVAGIFGMNSTGVTVCTLDCGIQALARPDAICLKGTISRDTLG